jgi:hypothetical protein
MYFLRFGAMLILGLSLAGCSAFTINTDYDPGASFLELRTYDWAPAETEAPKDPRVENDLLEARVHDAVDAELSARGYSQVAEGEAADFWVTYHAGVEAKIDVTTIQQAYPYYRGYSRWGGYSETYVRNYDEGTLILDVIDPETDRLIWRGSAQAQVNDRSTPEKREKRVRDAAAAILDRFPPQNE